MDLCEAALDAEVKIGELMARVPKATKGTGGNRYQQAPVREKDTAGDFSKPKSDVIRDAGFTPKQVERFQSLAAHPEIVEQAKAEAVYRIPFCQFRIFQKGRFIACRYLSGLPGRGGKNTYTPPGSASSKIP